MGAQINDPAAASCSSEKRSVHPLWRSRTSQVSAVNIEYLFMGLLDPAVLTGITQRGTKNTVLTYTSSGTQNIRNTE